jgi:membrane protein implicated in regulation of membrane protease activity
MRRRLRWESPTSETTPKHPYRDTLLVYGGAAVLIVVIATLTGGGFARAIGFAIAFFVVATLWSFRNWRNRLRAARSEKDELP